MVGAHIEATSKSKHAGVKGTILHDYGNYLVITPDNKKYNKAYKDSITGEIKFQVDSKLIKILKD